MPLRDRVWPARSSLPQLRRDYAPFGFGPAGPARDHGSEPVLWACPEHRAEVERTSGARFWLGAKGSN